MALQILPPHARHSMVIHACTRNNKERHPFGCLSYLFDDVLYSAVRFIPFFAEGGAVAQVSLLQLADGFGDVDEVVGDTFGVLGKGDILGAGLRFADAQREALDMVTAHHRAGNQKDSDACQER